MVSFKRLGVGLYSVQIGPHRLYFSGDHLCAYKNEETSFKRRSDTHYAKVRADLKSLGCESWHAVIQSRLEKIVDDAVLQQAPRKSAGKSWKRGSIHAN